MTKTSNKLNERSILLGFKNLDDYFQKNFSKNFRQMAEDLGVAYQTVSTAYDNYTKSVFSKEKNAPTLTK